MTHKFKSFSQIALLSCIFIVLSLLVSWVESKHYLHSSFSYSTFANTASIVSSMVLLGIALALFGKYGGSQEIINKQTEQVLTIVQTIANLKFSATLVGPKTKSGSGILNISIFSCKERLDEAEKTVFRNNTSEFRKAKHYPTDELSAKLYKITLSADEIYMPKPVIDKIKELEENLSPCGVNTSIGELSSSILVIEASPFGYSIPDDKILKLAPFYGPYIKRQARQADILRIIHDLREVYSECIKWLRANNEEVFSTLNVKTDKYESGLKPATYVVFGGEDMRVG